MIEGRTSHCLLSKDLHNMSMLEPAERRMLLPRLCRIEATKPRAMRSCHFAFATVLGIAIDSPTESCENIASVVRVRDRGGYLTQLCEKLVQTRSLDQK